VRLNERANEALYRVLSLTIVFRYKYTEPGYLEILLPGVCKRGFSRCSGPHRRRSLLEEGWIGAKATESVEALRRQAPPVRIDIEFLNQYPEMAGFRSQAEVPLLKASDPGLLKIMTEGIPSSIYSRATPFGRTENSLFSTAASAIQS
jgi:hypothetical protein